jgi:hypothetical protein
MTADSALADRVRKTRGVFRFSKPFLFVHWLFIILFGFVFPAFFAYVISAQHIPMASWNADVWTGVALIPASIGIGFLLNWLRPVRWEFTDTEIVCFKAERVTWRVAYSDITDVKIQRVFRGMRVLWLRTQKQPYTVIFSDPNLVRSVDAPDT